MRWLSWKKPQLGRSTHFARRSYGSGLSRPVWTRQSRNKALQGWVQPRLNDDSPALRRASMRLARGATPGSEQLKYAAKHLIEWRDYTADWTRRDCDREAELDSLVERILDAAPKV